jgi:Fe-S-cluster containining protein
VSDGSRLDAGDFSAWLRGADAAIRDGATSAVPCGDCTACCTSSRFVHVGPDETATLARIPRALLFPAPGMPRGHVLLGYDARGHCPMLVDGRCSIYDDRPRTCRSYDCRVFAATGVAPAEAVDAAIARQAERWRFSVATPAAGADRAAARAAAAFLRAHPELLAEAGIPANPTQIAVVALAIRAEFANGVVPARAAVAAALRHWAPKRSP